MKITCVQSTGVNLRISAETPNWVREEQLRQCGN